jgi:hypothetical protein
MTIIVSWVILAFAIGLGTGQSIERNSATAQANRSDFISVDKCYRNGRWYNPCPPDPDPEPPDPPGYPEIPRQQ